MEYDIRDIRLRDRGIKRIMWAATRMPVLNTIRKELTKSHPLRGVKIAACLHVTTETANLILTLKEGGAQIRLTASNPLSTQDDVAAALVTEYGIPVFAIKGEARETYYKHINQALDIKPHITMDDGADLISTLHRERQDLISNVVGGTEETTTGVVRLKQMATKGVLSYPVIAVNDSYTKYLFDNRYGTGQSTIDAIMRATNILLAGKTFVVAGYGWCGRGIAWRARGMGSHVIVTETNPIRALEAVMDGFTVMPIRDAIKVADIVVTATGDINVVDVEHFKSAKDGVILANAGHFDVEINIQKLYELADKVENVKPMVDCYHLGDKRIYLLAEGRLVNLSAAEGHPAEVMDMSFANQARAVEYLVKHGDKLENKVYKLPDEIDRDIAIRKLKVMGVEIDKLTPEQRQYLSSWEWGT